MIETLPARLYRDPAVFSLEREAVFAGSWWVLGHEGSVPKPGDVRALTAAGWPLLLLRDGEGQVRVFHNVCRHRAAPLVWDGEQVNVPALQCRYHGWRYGLDGALLRAPHHGADPDCDALFSVPVRLWRGLVFVCPRQSGPPPDFEPLRAVLDEVCTVSWADQQVVQHAEHRIRCNWKTYVENYLEGWHIPWLHPKLAREVDVRKYQVAVHEGVVTHQVPARDGALSEGFWAWLWPSTAINVYRDGMSIECIVPDGHDATRIVYTYLSRDSDSDSDSIRLSAEVTAEDVRICEAVQRNLDAGVYATGELSPRHERGVEDFQRRVAAALAPHLGHEVRRS